jgi:type III pantothenate kinase
VITPGVQISAEALFARAARLSRVEIALPPKVVGRNPVHSMQSGIVYGYAGLVDGLAARLQKELGYPCRVVATGGLAKLIAPLTEAIEHVDDDLTLTGLRILYERNVAEGARGAAASPAADEGAR